MVGAKTLAGKTPNHPGRHGVARWWRVRATHWQSRSQARGPGRPRRGFSMPACARRPARHRCKESLRQQNSCCDQTPARAPASSHHRLHCIDLLPCGHVGGLNSPPPSRAGPALQTSAGPSYDGRRRACRRPSRLQVKTAKLIVGDRRRCGDTGTSTRIGWSRDRCFKSARAGPRWPRSGRSITTRMPP